MRQNTNRWRNHVFASNSDRSVNNVRNYFYRYEFQKGGHCSHSGLFEDMTALSQDQFSASIPWGSADEAFEIFDLQSSRSSALPLR